MLPRALQIRVDDFVYPFKFLTAASLQRRPAVRNPERARTGARNQHQPTQFALAIVRQVVVATSILSAAGCGFLAETEEVRLLKSGICVEEGRYLSTTELENGAIQVLIDNLGESRIEADGKNKIFSYKNVAHFREVNSHKILFNADGYRNRLADREDLIDFYLSVYNEYIYVVPLVYKRNESGLEPYSKHETLVTACGAKTNPSLPDFYGDPRFSELDYPPNSDVLHGIYFPEDL